MTAEPSPHDEEAATRGEDKRVAWSGEHAIAEPVGYAVPEGDVAVLLNITPDHLERHGGH